MKGLDELYKIKFRGSGGDRQSKEFKRSESVHLNVISVDNVVNTNQSKEFKRSESVHLKMGEIDG